MKSDTCVFLPEYRAPLLIIQQFFTEQAINPHA